MSLSSDRESGIISNLSCARAVEQEEVKCVFHIAGLCGGIEDVECLAVSDDSDHSR